MTPLRSPFAAALLAVLALTGGALAQTSDPDKPITMIVPFPPGGVADSAASDNTRTEAPWASFLIDIIEAPANGAGAGCRRDWLDASA